MAYINLIVLVLLLRGSTGLRDPIMVSSMNSIKLESTLNALGLLTEKALDTCEDIYLHIRRLVPLVPSASGIRKKVLVLGSGWSAHAFLKVIDSDIYDVTCISPRPFFIFTPMLASTAVGTVEYRSIVENIRMANPHVNYFEGEAINIRDDEVEVMSTVSPEKFVFNVPYDFLVYSVGSQVADFGVPGVKEHCCFIKEIEDVKKIKNQIFKAFERASLPTMKADDIKRLLTFVVVGGGPTGVEFTGELSDFISEEVSRLYPMLKDKAKIILLNSASNILTAFDKVLQEKALSFLEERGIDMRLKTRVKAVTATSINYSSGEDAPLMELPYGLCVWAAGNACREITRTFATTLNPGQELSVKTLGRLSVDPFLRLLRNDLEGAYSNMFALGDVANIASGSLPQTAQVAAQQGAYLARLLNRGYNTSTSVPSLPANLWTADTMKALQVRGLLAARSFSFLNLGLLAYVGDSEAVAQIQLGDATIVDTAGTKAFLLWRSVYIVKQVSVRTRLLVIFDYIKTKLFGRDLTTL